MSYQRAYVGIILLTFTILAISACGLFDYSHIPNEWKKIAKAECKKRENKKDQKPSEERNFKVCVSKKVNELKKKYITQHQNETPMVPNIGFKFGLFLGL